MTRHFNPDYRKQRERQNDLVLNQIENVPGGIGMLGKFHRDMQNVMGEHAR